MTDPMLPLAGLSPSLREVEQRLRVAERLAACMTDPRASAQIAHSLADIIRFRLIARVEVGAEGPDTRYVVTNLNKRNPRALQDVYCRRGQAENRIKSLKTHLASDRTSCTKATANQLRLFLHAGAYG